MRDSDVIVRSNIEHPLYTLPSFPLIVTFYKTVEQYHKRNTDTDNNSQILFRLSWFTCAHLRMSILSLV